MRALVARRHEGVWSAEWEDVIEPRVATDGVLVETRAAALAWNDILQMEGT